MKEETKNEIQKLRNLQPEKRMQLYNEAMKLYENGLRQREIERTLEISRSIVYYWVRKGVKPLTSYNQFESKPSKELSYVIGVAFGDANLSNKRLRRWLCGLRAKDKDFVEKYAKYVAKLLNKEKYNTIRLTKDGIYEVNCKSRFLYEFLKRKFDELKPFIENFPAEFVMGFFDSEGSVFPDISKKRKSFRPAISATNTNFELLKYIQYLLYYYFGIRSIIIGNRCSILRINRFADVQQFAKFIGFSIGRKEQKLMDAIALVKKYGNGFNAIILWQYFYEKTSKGWTRRSNNLIKVF